MTATTQRNNILKPLSTNALVCPMMELYGSIGSTADKTALFELGVPVASFEVCPMLRSQIILVTVADFTGISTFSSFKHYLCIPVLFALASARLTAKLEGTLSCFLAPLPPTAQARGEEEQGSAKPVRYRADRKRYICVHSEAKSLLPTTPLKRLSHRTPPEHSTVRLLCNALHHACNDTQLASLRTEQATACYSQQSRNGRVYVNISKKRNPAPDVVASETRISKNTTPTKVTVAR